MEQQGIPVHRKRQAVSILKLIGTTEPLQTDHPTTNYLTPLLQAAVLSDQLVLSLFKTELLVGINDILKTYDHTVVRISASNKLFRAKILS